MSIVYKKPLVRDGKRPMLLYALRLVRLADLAGVLSSSRLALLDRGVIYAIAHIRGGGELGEPWREAGPDDEEDEHLHRLHRLRRAPGQRQVHVAAIGS